MIKGKNAFAANSVLEGAGFFIALFLILTVLVKFLFFPTGIAEAASSEKSLLGLERNIERIDRNKDILMINYPLSIGKDICFVGFSKGKTEMSDCNSFVSYSCLCMFRGDDCEIMIECSDFRQFNKIVFEGTFSGTELITDTSGQTKGIKGTDNDKHVKNIEVSGTTENNLHIKEG